jgi:cobaltochelatase CobT
MPDLAELGAITVRAMAGRPDVRLRGGRLYEGRQPLPVRAAHLFPAPGDDRGSFRGAADGIALRLLHSDPVVHLEHRPSDPLAWTVFEMLEQFRVESLAPDTLPGVVRNLRHRHEQWALAAFHAGAAESARGLLLYTVAQVCRARICGQQVVEATEDAIEATRAALGPRIGADLLGLRRHRTDQRLFARHARSVADTVATMLHGPAPADPAQDATDDDRAALLLPEPDGDGDGDVHRASAGGSVGATAGYRVFTTAFDREHDVGTVLRAELLAQHRTSLDELVARRHVPVNRLVRDLTMLLAAPVPDGWDGAQEAGRLDGRMLTRLITSPTERLLFRVERSVPAADVLVTFLVDCSGSMKARRADVAVLVDVFARALELAGADSEVLGFTTGAWHGGRARRDWQRAGRPPGPGRLNERCHLVFKPAGASWRLSRRRIAGLLATELFREGVDGEAVEWAAGRARSHPARRRLLVVLGDGSPMDRATALANGDDYLDQHLRDVVADLERDGTVEVHGLGVDADLSRHYRWHRRLDPLSGNGFHAFRDVLDLIARPCR